MWYFLGGSKCIATVPFLNKNVCVTLYHVLFKASQPLTSVYFYIWNSLSNSFASCGSEFQFNKLYWVKVIEVQAVNLMVAVMTSHLTKALPCVFSPYIQLDLGWNNCIKTTQRFHMFAYLVSNWHRLWNTCPITKDDTFCVCVFTYTSKDITLLNGNNSNSPTMKRLTNFSISFGNSSCI